MATIDKLDISVYNLYAMRTKMIEQINQQYRLSEAGTIPPQTAVMDMYPRLSELDLLLGIVPLHAPWAYFFPPKTFRRIRRSPFAFHRVAPSLGTFEEQEEVEAALEQVDCGSPEEKKEKEILQQAFSQINKINEWLSFIIGRVGQFLQG
ncbi:MAG: DUF5399 domain-containing protein [Chlamydiales bacterium]|nr:DUF5399 domain-containing protein [Chlamydiia bacterium]MCP5508520.1 DUF5399 domain-containing protein [Chlamydiales bacterium]